MNPPNPQQSINKPPTAPLPSESPMFVMPPEYRHGATGKKMAVPAPPPKPAVVPPPVAPPPPAVPKKKTKGLPRHTKVVLIAGGILLVGLAIAGFLVLRGLEPAEVVPEERPEPTTRPAPVEEEPEPEPEPEPSSAEATEGKPESPFPTASTPGTDTDSDGLTDLEERLVYGTNVALPDTDSDGFLDGNEVYHRYNPGGTAPGTLLESGLVRQLTGPASDAAWYRLLFPSVWSESDLIDDWGADVSFTATTGEKIGVTMLERQEGVAFADWVATLTRQDAGVLSTMTTKNGYQALMSEDQLTVYVDGSAASSVGAGYAIRIQYDVGIKATIDYLQTFKMMVNSLEWL